MRFLILLLAGLLLGLGLLELRLRSTGTAIEPPQPASGEHLRILALGDSITRGLDRKGGSYPEELQQLLWRAKVKVPVEVINAGVAGLETADLARSLEETLDRVRPQVVITMIGMADLSGIKPSWGGNLRVFRLFGLLADQWRRWRWKQDLEEDAPIYSHSEGAVMREERNYKKAIQANLEVLERNPRHQMALQELGQICRDFDKLELAEMYFRKAIALGKEATSPARRFSWSYVLLLMMFEDTQQWEKAAVLAGEIEREFPDSLKPFDFLADFYHKRGLESERARLLLAGVRARPSSSRLHLLLARALAEQGKEEESRRELEQSRLLERESELSAGSVAAYREISQAIRARGIFHLAMQYPLHELELLRKKIGPEGELLRFVDNNASFLVGMQGKPYHDFFIDEFGGNFGHMTQLANSLMAANVFASLRPWLERNHLVE